jgi:hypothetical protein
MTSIEIKPKKVSPEKKFDPNKDIEKASLLKMEYENFIDSTLTISRKGMVVVYLGQNLPRQKEKKWLVRFWLDPKSFKDITKAFSEQVKIYENNYGEIEL